MNYFDFLFPTFNALPNPTHYQFFPLKAFQILSIFFLSIIITLPQETIIPRLDSTAIAS